MRCAMGWNGMRGGGRVLEGCTKLSGRRKQSCRTSSRRRILVARQIHIHRETLDTIHTAGKSTQHSLSRLCATAIDSLHPPSRRRSQQNLRARAPSPRRPGQASHRPSPVDFQANQYASLTRTSPNSASQRTISLLPVLFHRHGLDFTVIDHHRLALAPKRAAFFLGCHATLVRARQLQPCDFSIPSSASHPSRRLAHAC